MLFLKIKRNLLMSSLLEPIKRGKIRKKRYIKGRNRVEWMLTTIPR